MSRQAGGRLMPPPASLPTFALAAANQQVMMLILCCLYLGWTSEWWGDQIYRTWKSETSTSKNYIFSSTQPRQCHDTTSSGQATPASCQPHRRKIRYVALTLFGESDVYWTSSNSSTSFSPFRSFEILHVWNISQCVLGNLACIRDLIDT